MSRASSHKVAPGRLRAVRDTVPLADACIAGALLLLSVPALVSDTSRIGLELVDAPQHGGAVAFGLAAAQCVPLLWRRRSPLLAVLVVVAALTLRVLTNSVPAAADLSCLVVFDAVGAYAGWRLIVPTVVGMAVYVGAVSVLDPHPSSASFEPVILLWLMLVVAPTTVGIVRRYVAARGTPPATPSVGSGVPSVGGAVGPATGARIGQAVPGLSDLTLLNHGGFATVYRARQDALRRDVALKIDSRVLLTERDRRRFLREAEAAGRVSGHPNVVDLYDVGVLDDHRPYLVMKLCTGGSYQQRLRRKGRLGSIEVRDVGVAISDALQAAHDAGVLHRDVKPGNILIDQYGVPGLADFGLAALPEVGKDLSVTVDTFTPAYAPPETLHGANPTELGDVYSLAATLYALLAGRPPWFTGRGAPSVAEIVQCRYRPLPSLDDVPRPLFELLQDALSPNLAHRPQTAAEFRDELTGLRLRTQRPTTRY